MIEKYVTREVLLVVSRGLRRWPDDGINPRKVTAKADDA